MTTRTTPLASLPAAQASLVNAIAAAADALDQVAAGDVAAALARLQLAADAARAHIAGALDRLNATVAGVVCDLDQAAGNVLADLSAQHEVPIVRDLDTGEPFVLVPFEAPIPAPIAEAPAVETAAEADDRVELLALPPVVVTYSRQRSDAQKARQTAEASEPVCPSPATPIATPTAAQAFGEPVSVPAIAACSPVDPARDDRKANGQQARVNRRRGKPRTGAADGPIDLDAKAPVGT